MFGPLMRTSPSSPIFTSTSFCGLPTDPKRKLLPSGRLTVALVGVLLAGLAHHAHLHAHLDGLAQPLLVLDARGRERVDLLEHPRHRREEARVHLRDVRD